MQAMLGLPWASCSMSSSLLAILKGLILGKVLLNPFLSVLAQMLLESQPARPPEVGSGCILCSSSLQTRRQAQPQSLFPYCKISAAFTTKINTLLYLKKFWSYSAFSLSVVRVCPSPSQQDCYSRGNGLRVLQAFTLLTRKLSQRPPEGLLPLASALQRTWEWQERRSSPRPSNRRCVLPGREKFGEANPYTQPSFPLAFSKDKTERTARLANPN